MVWKFPWISDRYRKVAGECKKTALSGRFFIDDLQNESRWTQRDYNSLCRVGFMGNPVAYRAVRMISQAASAIPWLLYEGSAEYDKHPLLDLLKSPNERQAGVTFMETLYGHLLLSGNAYLEMISSGESMRELHLLRPDRVSVLTENNGWPVGLEYRQKEEKRKISLGMDKAGGGIHLSLFHPLDDHYGFPPLGAALVALDTHNTAGRWNKALLDNSARPSGALVYEPKEGGNLNQEQFERLRVELEENYSGPSKAGRPMLLEGGLNWKQIGLTPRDMDFIESKNSASRDIALAFGVPPMLIGIPGDSTYANYQEANRAFYRLTVLPLANRIAADLSMWLAVSFGENLRLALDLDQVEGLSSEREALWSRIGNAGFLTESEKREAVGYGPIEKN